MATETKNHLRAQRHRHPVVMVLFLFLLVGGTQPVSAFDDITVVGRKLSWKGHLATGWVGGNSNQMEAIIAKTNNATLQEIMREMLLDAQRLDVYFTHLDVTGIDTGTLSTIRANIIEGDFMLSEPGARDAFWSAYGDILEDEAGPGAVTSFASDRLSMTGGYTAFEATFETSLPGGGVVYKVMHLVDVGESLYHIFELKADSVKFRARKEEFENLLISVRYD